ncbi:HtpG family chaperone protein [Buttiauxella noackiae ATCC 51607]|uniref:HtpG family chaperone protein n=1 Tax=Buttiauxella noackiae ATCC 51607 TaxID=1354255 RepID=A0A1B7HHL3_9ENTR|nr:ATP-binding protein [Buttiauxella noackiae]OAT15121.1 HtpG family chaperone protein [Buttiauxella noackiae ATCC 51607]
MAYTFEKAKLWQSTLGKDDESVEKLRNSFLDFRKKIEALVKNIETELPGLTVHDISHIDSLWEVSDQIIGDKIYLNPMEAYVLGGAFLLHDAAHVSVAYEGGFNALKEKNEWKDLISLRFDNKEPEQGSDNEKKALFEIVRQLHANQARNLIKRAWKSEASNSFYFLISDEEIRNYYSELIGEIAESHHWSSKKVYETFLERKINAPAFFNVNSWEVDALKIAFILRTADAAHIDSRRAPTYAYNYLSPQGISKEHWHFQNKLGRATLIDNHLLRISSGSSFSNEERNAWWLAFDTAKMINKELQDAYNYLFEAGREPFEARKVLAVDSPVNFSKYVKAEGWEPEDISIHVSNLPRLISTLGGKALYGENNDVGLRELIQNGLDAIIAARKLGYLENNEGAINLNLEKIENDNWIISITDNGLGMSRYVLSDILLDFGKSLWCSDDVRYEHPTLAQTGFSSIGQFGIGFYSVFMLSNEVNIVTNRYKSKTDEHSTHWKLTFQNGLTERPFISRPKEIEQLKKHGTRISFKVKDEVLQKLLTIPKEEKSPYILNILTQTSTVFGNKENQPQKSIFDDFSNLIKWIFPACEIDINLTYNNITKKIITANDWTDIPDEELISRLQKKKENKKLYSLKCQGDVVGRLRITDNYYYLYESLFAVVSYKGARAGQLFGFQGICKSLSNNEKAERNDAIPDYPVECWKNWALDITKSEPFLSVSHQVRLHALIPQEDLNIWHIGRERCFLSQIKELLNSLDEILVLNGSIDYEEDDDIMPSEFERALIINNNVILIPMKQLQRSHANGITLDEILGKMGISSIKYTERLEKTISEVWGDFIEEDDEDRVIGHVNGKEIIRNTCIYKRNNS